MKGFKEAYKSIFHCYNEHGSHVNSFYISNMHWEKIPIKITVLAQYSCSIFIFMFILYCRIVKNMVLCMKFYISLCKFYRAAR